jgi:hypothetical protein
VLLSTRCGCAFERQRARCDPKSVPAGLLGHEILQRAGARRLGQGEFVGLAVAKQAKILGQHRQFGACLRRLRQSRASRAQIGLHIGAGDHLDGGHFHC